MSNFSDQMYDLRSNTSKLMIEKSAVISALEKLMKEYPSSSIPLPVIRQTLIDLVASPDFTDLSTHPSLQKLDEVLLKAKTQYK